MNESLLHYLWKNRLFSNYQLQTTDCKDISLIYTGYPHQDAGPDFKQAIIRIEDITWVGDVEIHVRTSDWYKHKHQLDAKYQCVILHVVYENDTEIGGTFPTLELKKYISHTLIERYEQLSVSSEPLPCYASLCELEKVKYVSLLSRLAAERLERRQQEIFTLLHSCRDDWLETSYRLLMRNFGFRTNSDAFEALARSLPYRYIERHRDSKLQIYALLFGQAGLLDEDLEDEYYEKLQAEYAYLQYKYKLNPISRKMWNLLRLRPQNFPCMRLAQVGDFLCAFPNIVSDIIEISSQQLITMLSQCNSDAYWQTHFHFGKLTTNHNCNMGRTTINGLIINTLLPIRFAMAAFRGEIEKKSRVLTDYEEIDFEYNKVTRQYISMGFPADNALCSQAILELHQHYCQSKRCLDCDIGCYVMRKE